MKKIIFSLTILFLASCSKPEDNQLEDKPSSSNIKLLKSVTEKGGSDHFLSLYYENNILLKINSGEKDNYIDKGQLRYDNGKISKSAYQDSPRGANNPEDFNYNYVFENPNIYLTTISYVSNSIYMVAPYHNDTFNLNNQKQVISITENNSLADEFIYSNNQILKQKHLGDSKQGEYTFAFDDKINPFNVLYTKFGLLDNSICPLLSGNTLYYFLMPNNITKVYKDGLLLHSYIYQYNYENYPISAVGFDHSRNETSQYSFAYAN